MAKVAVTGGAGFLGSHLCDALVARGDEVVCIDSFQTGHEDNIRHLLDNGSFTPVRHDITEPINLDVDAIFNLACPASPVHYQADPIGTTKTSVLGALTVLEAGRRSGATVFQASTSEVYGDPLVHPQPESYRGAVNPIGPRACYDEGKRCAESLFFDYHRCHGVPIKVVRIFNTYGPRMHPEDGRVVSNFIMQALRGEDITIYGDGGQTRSFCYCDDLIQGFLKMMASPAGCTGPVNLGNPGEFTILELARKVLDLTGSGSRLVYLPLPQDDPMQRQPDIALAERELGWRPTVELEQGLKTTIAYFDAVLRKETMR